MWCLRNSVYTFVRISAHFRVRAEFYFKLPVFVTNATGITESCAKHGKWCYMETFVTKTWGQRLRSDYSAVTVRGTWDWRVSTGRARFPARRLERTISAKGLLYHWHGTKRAFHKHSRIIAARGVQLLLLSARLDNPLPRTPHAAEVIPSTQIYSLRAHLLVIASVMLRKARRTA